MLGRKTYTQEEFDTAQTAMADQTAAFTALAKAVAASKDKKAAAALDVFEPLFFNSLTLALDRCFVHRVRGVSGKDGNPLNEVEVICDSLMTNGGVLQASTVLKVVPAESVSKIEFGDAIRITADQFDRLSSAFLAEIEARFLA